MKTVTATVVYSNNAICNLTVNHKGNLVTLIKLNPDESKPFISFNGMYAFVLKMLKNNDFKCNYFEAFGARWYNIQWIDVNNPTRIENFGYRG